MTVIGRSIVRSEGYIGGPGFNIIHWTAGLGAGPTHPDGVEEWHDTLLAALTNYEGNIPDSITLTIEPDVAFFDDSDGVIDGVTVDPAGARVVDGLTTGALLSRATQLVVRTRTNEYVNGRRLQGRIFLGPIGNNALSADGQVLAAIVTDAPTNWSGLISGLGGRLCVWHRPTPAAPTSGTYGDVVSIGINSTPGTLRSRKT